MKRQADHHDLAARLGLDEADLLAWIEGDVDAETDDRVQRLLKAAPLEDAKAVVAMRRDAILLNTTDLEPAPADLVALAVAQADVDIERGMLLEDGRPIPFRQARTRVVRSPGWMLDLVFDSMVGRLAIAAVLIVSAGSAVYLAMGTWQSPPPRPIQPQVAGNDQDDVAEDVSDDALEITLAGTEQTEPQMEGPEPPPVIETHVVDVMPMETARRLCAERRLLLRVTTESSLDTLARLDGFIRESHRGRPWSLHRTDDGDMIAAVDSALPRMPEMMIAPPETIFADSDGPVDAVEIADLPPIPEFAPTVYLASVRIDESSLDVLVDAMQRGAVTGIEMIELDEPLPVLEAVPTRESIFWWSRPVEEWLPRSDVAIVIDVE